MADLTPSERVDHLERLVLDCQARLITLERACVHQIANREIMDRAQVRTGRVVTTTSQFVDDPDRGGSWEGGGV